MKKKVFFTALVAVCSLITTSCGSDDETPEVSDSKVEITATVTAAVTTRANQPYAPEGGKLTLLYGTLSATGNQRVEFTCTAGNWTANPALMWKELTPNADGKYPFFAAAPAVPVAAPAVPAVSADQSTTAEYTKSDQLMAYSVVQRKEAVALTFKHVLAQMSITFTSPDGKVDLSKASVSLKGPRTGYTIDSSQPTTDQPVKATATGTAGSQELKPYKLTNSSNTDTYYLLVPTQTLEPGELTLSIVNGENSYTWSNSEQVVLLPGQNNQFNMNVIKSIVTLAPDGIRVTDWDENPTIVKGSLTINVGGTPDSPTGTAPAFTSMKLWKGQAAMTSATAPADAKTYTKDATGAWISDAPFYIDDINPDDLFYTLTENSAADATTGLKELVAAGPISMKGGSLALNYRHLMAKLQVTLNKSADFPLSIADATIKSLAMSKAFALEYASTQSIAAKATGDAGNYDLKAYDATNPTQNNYIVVPQTLTKGSSLTVTLKDGNTYTARLATDLVIVSGKVHTIALTLNSSGVAITMGLTDWMPGDSTTGDMED